MGKINILTNSSTCRDARRASPRYTSNPMSMICLRIYHSIYLYTLRRLIKNNPYPIYYWTCIAETHAVRLYRWMIALGRLSFQSYIVHRYIVNLLASLQGYKNYLRTAAISSSTETRDCSPLSIFFSVIFPASISFSPAIATKGICLLLA